jgi:hypothetical protein
LRRKEVRLRRGPRRSIVRFVGVGRVVRRAAAGGRSRREGSV